VQGEVAQPGTAENQFKKLKGLFLWIVGATVVIALLGYLAGREGRFKEFLQFVDQLPAVGVITLMAVLPILGFSVSIVYVMAGMKFGTGIGILVVGFAITCHLVGSYWLGRHIFSAKINRLLRKRDIELPDVPRGEEASVTLLTALIPGLPYAVRNYTLALTNVPFWTYFGICLPVYLLRSCIAIFLGDMTADFSITKTVIFGSVLTVKLVICGMILVRLRRRLERKRAGGESG
jgi:uncharacterized membrane protein YdjX (TVP38/TMEM64 family)